MKFSIRQLLASGQRAINWPLAITLAGFILLVPLYSLWLNPLSWVTRQLSPAPFAAYLAAVRDAAIKTPESDKKLSLAAIDLQQPDISVTSFSAHPPQSPLRDELWVSLPNQLKEKCLGETDPARALRQIPGLPPTSEPRLVYEIIVKTKDLLRPCISDQRPTTTSCSMDEPKEPELHTAKEASDLPIDKLREDYITLRQAYDDLRVVTGQIWSSYQIGFPQDYSVRSGDYPGKGYPFTGMGWTYDWRPTSKSHVGVSEFVVRKNAEILVKGSTKPEAFCATAK